MLASFIALCPVLFATFAFGVLCTVVIVLMVRRFQARCANNSFDRGFDRLTQEEIDRAERAKSHRAKH